MTEKSSEILNALGLASIFIGKEASDESLKKIFSIASKQGSAVKFLRLGGPKNFRNDIISIVTEDVTTEGYKLVVDKNITEIEFILVNPYSESFLTRMDAEKKDNAEIWRVRDQVLQFARGLIVIREKLKGNNKQKIKIAFHRTDLIWNLGIVGDDYVVARAYHKSASGHDEKGADIHLKTGNSTRLAESLISYYNYVRNDIRTQFLCSIRDLTTPEIIGTWPSLFKGNAFYITTSDISTQVIEKDCCSPIGEKAELNWLSYSVTKAPPCIYFKPVRKERKEISNEPWQSQKLFIHFIDGISAAEFLWHLQIISNTHPELKTQLENLAGNIVLQAFNALSEFRVVWKKTHELNSEMTLYPWIEKLKDAFREGGRFVTENHQELNECYIEIEKIGKDLEESRALPFRDAHLKNRIIKFDRKLYEKYLFCWNNIPGSENGRLIEFLKNKFSIDWIETAQIDKIEDNRIIRLYFKNKTISLKLNDDETKISLRIDDGRTDEFIVRTKNGKQNIYEINYSDFCDWIKKLGDLEHIFEWLKKNTYDIDFETCLWLVNKWDDLLHILWSNSTGIQAKELTEGYNILKKWGLSTPKSKYEEDLYWKTLLSRSLREYCRRLWYYHVMPQTYMERYRIEERDHFLKLASGAIKHIDGYEGIKKFLRKCEVNSDIIWHFDDKREAMELIVAKVPSFDNKKNRKKPQVNAKLSQINDLPNIQISNSNNVQITTANGTTQKMSIEIPEARTKK